jgi:hypothetical protein
MTKSWRKLRIVVEVPVKGDYTERDLSWDVRRLVCGSQFNRFNKNVKFGKVEVKEFNKVSAREKPKNEIVKAMQALLKLHG